MLQVEEFTTEELTDRGEIEKVEEVKSLVEQLALHGQEKFFATDKATIFPYRKMTEQERVVYDALCPQHTKLEDYGDGVIPLRVLQIASHANELGFFKTLMVWHPQNGDVSDPVLIGVHEFRREGQNWDTTEQYILARWGTILKPFVELVEDARIICEAKLRKNLVDIKEKVESQLRTVEDTARNYVLGNGGSVSPAYYG